MCYQVYLSTDADVDLSTHNSDLLKFSKDLPHLIPPGLLAHGQMWHVQSRSICSCSFRHAADNNLGFGNPVDWYPEDKDDLAATAQFTAVVRSLLSEGARIDCLDTWNEDALGGDPPPSVDIDLSTMTDTEFRFFENHRFTFVAGPGSEETPRDA